MQKNPNVPMDLTAVMFVELVCCCVLILLLEVYCVCHEQKWILRVKIKYFKHEFFPNTKTTQKKLSTYLGSCQNYFRLEEALFPTSLPKKIRSTTWAIFFAKTGFSVNKKLVKNIFYFAEMETGFGRNLISRHVKKIA